MDELLEEIEELTELLEFTSDEDKDYKYLILQKIVIKQTEAICKLVKGYK